MVSWVLIPIFLGTVTVAKPMAKPIEMEGVEVMSAIDAYQGICRVEAKRQGAPAAIVEGSCSCLAQRLEALDQLPSTSEALKAFTEENRLACVFAAILEL